MPNTTLSSRGRLERLHAARKPNGGPGLLQRMVRHGSRRTKPRRPDYRISAPLRDSTPAAGAAPPPSTPTGGQRTRRRRPQRREPGRRRREPRPRPTAPRDGDNDMSAACWTPPRRGLSAEHPAQQPGPRERENTARKPNCGPGLLQRMVRHGSRPNKAATTNLPHHRPRRDRTPRRPTPRRLRPDWRRREAKPTTATPRRHEWGRPPLQPPQRQPPCPLPLLTTICQRPRARTPSACECRTPSSAAGAAGRQHTARWRERRPRSAAAIGSALGLTVFRVILSGVPNP